VSCSESLCRERPLTPFPRTQIDGDTRWYLGLNLLFVKTARAIWKDGYLPALVANGLLDCDKLSIDAVRRRGGCVLDCDKLSIDAVRRRGGCVAAVAPAPPTHQPPLPPMTGEGVEPCRVHSRLAKHAREQDHEHA
jgi:hypothetical protein